MSEIEYQYRLVDYNENTGDVTSALKWSDWKPGDPILVDGWEGIEFREKKAEPKKSQRQYRWMTPSGVWTGWLDVNSSGTADFHAEGVAKVEFRDKPEAPKWEKNKRYRLIGTDEAETVIAVSDDGHAMVTYRGHLGVVLTTRTPQLREDYEEVPQ